MEHFFKRKLENDTDVLAFSWGKLCEVFVHNLLPNQYVFHSDKTLEHPTIPSWVGTPDGSKRNRSKIQTVTDIKCPLTLKSFFALIRPIYEWDGYRAKKLAKIDGMEVMNRIRFGYTDSNGMKWPKHKDGDKFYWQLVSNACITGAKFAELIIFVPYIEQLEKITTYNRSLDEPYWLVERAKEGELPYIYKQSGVKNINVIRFEVPQADKDFLKSRVNLAIDLIYK
jgi:hypothetical protein